VGKRLLSKDGQPVTLGGRALDILILLVGRPGEVVGKRELIEQVWPDAVVDEGSLRFHMSGLRKALGEGIQGARYIATQSGRGYCFVAPLFRGEPEAPGERHLGTASEPAPRTAFPRMIGRDAVVDELCAAVMEQRFVTICGPGGIGKTTVAASVGRRLASNFEGRVRFVDLASVASGNIVATAVASAVGLVAHTPDLVPALISYLEDKSILIVLDSCEHVIDAAAELAEQIFAGAPGVHLLATTRELLRVHGEHVHQLLPLESPPDHSDVTSSTALEFPAVQLFVERVAAAGVRFELTDEDSPAVAEICRTLDGIPLAIELAAGRVNAYGIGGIAALLGEHLRHLVNARRTALPRHHTLSATLDWSHDLLSAAERTLLRRLAIFIGPFTLEGARAVTAFEGLADAEAVEALGNLVCKSLVTIDFTSRDARYRLLDTTRAYAWEKLEESGETDQVARRHAAFYRDLLDIERANSDDGAFAGEQHLGNIRSALEWCFGKGAVADLGTALASSAVSLFVELSLLAECSRWAQRGIAALDERTRGTRREINLQAALGHSLMFTEGNNERVRLAFSRGLELAGELGESLMELRLLGSLHLFNERVGNYHGAVEFAERANEVAKALGHPAAVAAAGSFCGLSQHLLGNHSSARALLDAALAQCGGSPQVKEIHFGFDYRNRSRITLARHLWLTGEVDEAAALAERTIQDAARLGHPVTLCIALIWGITVFLWNGDVENSSDKIERFLAHARKHSLEPYNAVGVGYQGELCILRGEGAAGIRHLEAALGALHAARYELVTTTFMIALAQGYLMTGKATKALGTIEETLRLIEANGDLLYLPEAFRTKGSILASGSVGDAGGAEECFCSSLALAEGQSALSWQLRTAVSFAKLRAQQGRHEEARGLLGPVLAQMASQTASADIGAARELLVSLAETEARAVDQQGH
jgi:predicted ATPase/DNA-binding winged helix-turn-helix (wHTH) protein